MKILKDTKSKVNELTQWSNLTRYSDSKFVSSAYVWLFIVPIIAKAASNIGNTFTLELSSQTLIFDLQLPFSWLLLFTAALIFTACNLLYAFFCPDLIKEVRDLGEYKSQGKTINHLLRHMTEEEKQQLQDYKRAFMEGAVKVKNPTLESLSQAKNDITNEWFWKVFNSRNTEKPCLRIIIGTLYSLASGVFGYILYQNTVYVFTQ